jgi:hypothetical protein
MWGILDEIRGRIMCNHSGYGLVCVSSVMSFVTVHLSLRVVNMKASKVWKMIKRVRGKYVSSKFEHTSPGLYIYLHRSIN